MIANGQSMPLDQLDELVPEGVMQDQVNLAPSALLLRRMPEARLWLAVIEGAMRESAWGDTKIARKARMWLKSPSEEVGSFRWALTMLLLEPDAHQPRIIRALEGAKRCSPKTN